MSPREFSDRFCEFGGIRLRFDGKPGWKGLRSCSQYAAAFGCSIHKGRPLVCRLYPLGRQKQGEERIYVYEGDEFPCLEGCPEVADLPRLTVSDYMEDQKTELFEKVQDLYLEMMEDVADNAFALLLETGLAASGDRNTLRTWRKMGRENPESLAARLEKAGWLDLLVLPDIKGSEDDPESFCRDHYNLIISRGEEDFASIESPESISAASSLMMAAALQLGRALGADPAALAEHWIAAAKSHGALD